MKDEIEYVRPYLQRQREVYQKERRRNVTIIIGASLLLLLSAFEYEAGVTEELLYPNSVEAVEEASNIGASTLHVLLEPSR